MLKHCLKPEDLLHPFPGTSRLVNGRPDFTYMPDGNRTLVTEVTFIACFQDRHTSLLKSHKFQEKDVKGGIDPLGWTNLSSVDRMPYTPFLIWTNFTPPSGSTPNEFLFLYISSHFRLCSFQMSLAKKAKSLAHCSVPNVTKSFFINLCEHKSGFILFRSSLNQRWAFDHH